MGGTQALKRIPRIKFPNRRSNSAASGRTVFPSASHQRFLGSASETQAASSASDANLSFFSSSNASAAVGGKASLQPKRTPVSKEEIEAVLQGSVQSKRRRVFVMDHIPSRLLLVAAMSGKLDC
ncbi:uncharacterized protein HKW66_Vig0015300 [Vigna angularis]|uniref:Uncharacterized protein n=1 Tax=Phaseolus angularis TaxID=3914 RepID=A0A8T0LJF9_PHAAN|nr:uncharacterized protein HKW66_Vig0015300 [Vigna angularis]